VIITGDCAVELKALPANSVDAAVTDPPYELGFMGKGWDKTGVAFRPETWAEILRVLKPGGHLLAFGGTRTYHRMTCAIEDAGFEIRDSLHWIYGTGFPKSLNLGDGRGTALKPAHEPIVLARKPLSGTVAATVAEHGTGALNIDATRIPTTENLNGGAYATESEGRHDGKENWRFQAGGAGDYTQPPGRWPANVLFDEDAAAELDAQSGTLKSGSRAAGEYGLMGYQGADAAPMPAVTSSTGGASRFFYVAKPTRMERDLGLDAFPVRSAGEATDREDGTVGLKSPRAGAGRTGGAKNHHPTVKPVTLMRYLVRLVAPPGGVVVDPFMGSGTTGMAAKAEGYRFIGIDLDPEYVKIAEARIAAYT
jgi:hypothetical protein